MTTPQDLEHALGVQLRPQLDFAADIPLWPGSNQVTVVARESADVRSVRTFFIYREAAQTAQVTPAKTP